MTQQEKIEWRATVLPIMKKHLTDTIGYPNCMIEQIMGQIRPMWELLEAQKLIVPGMTYQAFYHHAHDQAKRAEFVEHMKSMGIVF